MGFLISRWVGGSLQGYGVVLLLGIVFGLVSLGCQFLIADVNPKLQHAALPDASMADASIGDASMADASATSTADSAIDRVPETSTTEKSTTVISEAGSAAEARSITANVNSPQPQHPILQALLTMRQDTNLLMFLLYFNGWMFSLNLSNPFFNLYLLDDLGLDISRVTIYNSLGAAANLVLMVLWGKLADRVGNRPILLGVGILVAVTPLLWLVTGMNPLSVWLWLPLLHLLGGGTGAAIDLCTNNLQLGVVPLKHQSTCFGIVAALAGVSGAMGTLLGGVLAQCSGLGGLLGLFALSSVVRLIALLPLVFVHEHRSQPLRQILIRFWVEGIKIRVSQG